MEVWLFWGYLFFGFAVGMFTGMSKTPVVGNLLPLLFTFAGGGAAVLTVITQEDEDWRRELLGQELLGFSLGAIVGALFGAWLREKRALELTARSDD